MNDNAYRPMPANEAGGMSKEGLRSIIEADARVEELGDPLSGPNLARRLTPSKPCTEGGEHCFCVKTKAHYRRCCWCQLRLPDENTQRVPGRGPYRTELVRDV